MSKAKRGFFFLNSRPPQSLKSMSGKKKKKASHQLGASLGQRNRIMVVQTRKPHAFRLGYQPILSSDNR